MWVLVFFFSDFRKKTAYKCKSHCWDLFYCGYLFNVDVCFSKTVLTSASLIAGLCFIAGACLIVFLSFKNTSYECKSNVWDLFYCEYLSTGFLVFQKQHVTSASLIVGTCSTVGTCLSVGS